MRQRFSSTNHGQASQIGYKELFEVPTDDGIPLIVTRKLPLIQKQNLTPILLIHGLGQNRHFWDLPGRSMADFLVSKGFDVFIAELRGHGLSRANGAPYPNSFEEYVDYDVPALIHFICQRTQHPKIYLIGHSLGGAICYGASSEMQKQLKGFISVCGPFNFGKGTKVIRPLAKLYNWLNNSWINKTLKMTRLFPRHLSIDLVGVLTHRATPFLDNHKNRWFAPLWVPGTIEPNHLSQLLLTAFDRTGMAVFSTLLSWASEGRFLSTNRQHDYEQSIRQITIPVLFLSADKDKVVPPESIAGAYDKIGSIDRQWREFGKPEDHRHFGHMDIICGSDAPQKVWPVISDWLLKREQ
ncbi:alpha/beta hydrolase [Litoribacillus peritrichatus]|uniref:Alpha/beta fold hydrolase n=1 Tax=Litoribacillus peritrichatus TaxID=718191 RepID=A0ABP7M2H8_9GAMM